MPRRNGRLRFRASRREEIQRDFRDPEAYATTPEPQRINTPDVISSRGLWFWLAAALFGVAVGLFIAREPTRRR